MLTSHANIACWLQVPFFFAPDIELSQAQAARVEVGRIVCRDVEFEFLDAAFLEGLALDLQLTTGHLQGVHVTLDLCAMCTSRMQGFGGLGDTASRVLRALGQLGEGIAHRGEGFGRLPDLVLGTGDHLVEPGDLRLASIELLAPDEEELRSLLRRTAFMARATLPDGLALQDWIDSRMPGDQKKRKSDGKGRGRVVGVSKMIFSEN